MLSKNRPDRYPLPQGASSSTKRRTGESTPSTSTSKRVLPKSLSFQIFFLIKSHFLQVDCHRQWMKLHYQRYSIGRSINQSINRSINRPINQPTNRSIKQSIEQWINQANNQSIDQSIKQSIDRPIDRAITQSMNGSIDRLELLFK